MAYDETLAHRVRSILRRRRSVSEKRMFGGLTFLVNGNACCGLVGDRLMVRVGPDAYEEALQLPHVQKMDFTGRPLRGYVYVSPQGMRTDTDLGAWVIRGVTLARSLPAKLA